MQPLASGEFSTIRLRLLKIAVRIKEGDREPDQAGVRCKLHRSCAVPWIDRRADPASNVNDGGDVPCLTPPDQPPTPRRYGLNAVKLADNGVRPWRLCIHYDIASGWFGE